MYTNDLQFVKLFKIYFEFWIFQCVLKTIYLFQLKRLKRSSELELLRSDEGIDKILTDMRGKYMKNRYTAKRPSKRNLEVND